MMPYSTWRIGEAGIRRAPEPFCGFGFVDRDAAAELVKGAQIVFGLRITERRRFLHPFGGFGLVLAAGPCRSDR